MNKIWIKLILVAVLLNGGKVMSQASELQLERLFSDPALSGLTPRAVQFSPDGQRLTYLKGKEQNADRLDLWEFHLAEQQHRLLVDSDSLISGEETLSDEEKARRERMRLFASGIISYSWSKRSDALLFPLNGVLYYYDLAEKKVKQLTSSDSFVTDARISPSGRYVSYIREQNIAVQELATGKETQLTQDGGGSIKNGMAEFVAQEEMGRMTGYWWAPDDSKIAFLQIDESPVQEAVRNEIYADDIKLITQRYPYTGTANVRIKLGVVDLTNQQISWLPHGDNEDIYIPRVDWTRDPRFLSYQWQSRDQQQLELRLVDLDTSGQWVLLTEQSSTWLNLHDDLHFLADGSGFIWASERSGFKHLYYYDLSGKLIRQLTDGDWVVEALEAVDQKKGLIYFSGRKDTPLESHLYQLDLAGKHSVKRLTQPDYHHNIVMAEDAGSYIDSYSDILTPTKVVLRNADGQVLTWLAENNVDEQHPLAVYQAGLVKPRFGSLTAADGQTLYYRIYEPENLHKPESLAENKGYPVVVAVYGGPHVQRVLNSWSARDLYFQYLVQQGFIVFQLDNRGSYNRGKAFEDPIYRKLGDIELADQLTGVDYLRSLPYVDAENIGIYGHSYGGYMAIMAMLKAGQYFKAGVSGAPVTEWRLYDTHYTERYLGHPAENSKGYDESAVFPYAADLTGELLIYHGMADDNVLFTHSTKLYKVLQDAGSNFDMMNYPGSKHSMTGQPVQTHLHKAITRFFNRHLKH